MPIDDGQSPTSTFAKYGSEIDDFGEKLDGLRSQIRDASRNDVVAHEVTTPDARSLGFYPFGDPNPYFERSMLDLSLEGDRSWLPSYERFHNDIDGITDRLTWFVEDANLSMFDDVCSSLGDAIDSLAEANGDEFGHGGMELAHDELTKRWDSETRTHFTHQVYDRFGSVVGAQARLARELEKAARSYQEILARARVDSLDIASQLAGKLHVETDLAAAAIEGARTGLMIGGAVLGGVTVVSAAAAGRAAYVMGLTGLALDGFEGQQQVSHERMVTGSHAAYFIPSADERITAALDEMRAQDGIVQSALGANLSTFEEAKTSNPTELSEETIDQVGNRTITPGGREVEDIGDLGDPTKDLVMADIALIRLAGHTYLGAVAESLHQAHKGVDRARVYFEQAIRGVTYGHLHFAPFKECLGMLDLAIIRTRDYIDEIGQKLVEIADGYYETDSTSHDEMYRLFWEHSKTFDAEKYYPDSEFDAP